jgi:phospholipid transport system substrate-binding protein
MTEKVLEILRDPQLKRKEQERRAKVKELIYERFDFSEMARRSLGSEWRRLSPEQQKKFVRLFTSLLEDAYLDKIESYTGEKVQYGKERQDGDYAEVETKLEDDKTGREVSILYRLRNLNGDWKVYDVVIEDISLVLNYRSQFSRVLARSSVDELLRRMRGKQFNAPSAKS